MVIRTVEEVQRYDPLVKFRTRTTLTDIAKGHDRYSCSPLATATRPAFLILTALTLTVRTMSTLASAEAFTIVLGHH